MVDRASGEKLVGQEIRQIGSGLERGENLPDQRLDVYGVLVQYLRSTVGFFDQVGPGLAIRHHPP